VVIEQALKLLSAFEEVIAKNIDLSLVFNARPSARLVWRIRNVQIYPIAFS